MTHGDHGVAFSMPCITSPSILSYKLHTSPNSFKSNVTSRPEPPKNSLKLTEMWFVGEEDPTLSTTHHQFEFDRDEDDDEANSSSCSQDHTPSLQLETSQGGRICLLCFSNLISNPNSLSLHVSFALSQLSIAISHPPFLQTLLTFHSHLLVSSLTRLLSSTNDESIARQTIDLVSVFAESGDSSISSDFVARIADFICSSGSLSWNRRQIYTLHCLGVLLNRSNQSCDPSAQIKDKRALISNLINGLQLPSEEIRGEILFVLYKLSILECGGSDTDVDYFLGSCPRLLCLSLDTLVKTQSDEVRMNCVALLSVLAQRGYLKSSFIDDPSRGDSRDAEDSIQSKGIGTNNTSMIILFTEAIKGPLLSSDTLLQIGTLDLIFHCFSWEGCDSKYMEIMVEESISDYIFEILRLSGQKDPVVNSCLRVLDLLSVAEQVFRQRLAIGFSSLVPVLRYVAEVPFHPVQSHTLRLTEICLSSFPGIISMSQIEELVLILTGMFRRHTTNCELGMLPETFIMSCSIFVAILKFPSSSGIPILTASVQEASRNALLSCLSAPQKYPNQLLLYSLYFFKEANTYFHEANLSTNSNDIEMENRTIQVCETHLLPWLRRAIDEMEEEDNILGVLESFHSILLQGSDAQTKKLSEILASSSCFSLSFGCLGLFPTEKMKWRVYLMLSSIVDKVLGDDAGHPIRDAALYLPSDPLDLLFLLGQKSSHDRELISCQSAVLLILYCTSLYDERLAEGKQVLAYLEQYILVNAANFIGGVTESATFLQLVHLYSLFRGTAERSYENPYSLEAEKLLFHLVVENELNLLTARIHPVSLKWLFQQEKISKPLSNQVLNFCRLNSGQGVQIIIHGYNNQMIDLETIAELVAVGDNLAATHMVSLLKQLQLEEGVEDDIVSLVNVMILILNISPTASDQLCQHGIGKAIYSLYHYSSYSSSPHIFKICSLLIFNILRLAQSMVLLDHEVWIPLTVKLLEASVHTMDAHTCNQDALLVIGILCLILHCSTNPVFSEALIFILMNTYLVTAINSIIQEACSKGPALVDHDEETSMGKNLIFVLLLYYFYLKSMHALVPGAVDWKVLFELSDRGGALPMIYIRCHELCRFLYFGSSSVKLVASHCLLELLTIITDHRNEKLELNCSLRYLQSVMAVLEGLVFDSDIAVAINCGHCISIILGWQKQGVLETQVIKDCTWCRLVVEELALSLTAPGLASSSFSNQHKAATHVAVALLKLDQVPEWIRSVFNDSCISGIITNLSASNVSEQMVQLFYMLLISNYLKEEHISGLYHVFQSCRKHMYAGDSEDNIEEHIEKVVSMPDDLGKVYRVLFRLISWDSSPSMASSRGSSHTGNQRLLEQIEMFLKESSKTRTN